MSSQALKMWINGACFHIQMRLHLARLGEGDSTPARALISVYKTDWEMLLTEYKSFKLKSVTYTIEKKTTVTYHLRGSRTSWSEFGYEVTDDESQQTFETIGALKLKLDIDPVDKYVDVLMASCQINEVHDHFTELREHLDELINQQDAFDVTPLP